MLDITDHFVGQGMQMIPVGDPIKQKAVVLREGFSNEEIRGAYQAWNLIEAALQSEADRAILKRCKSPREVFGRIKKSGMTQRVRWRPNDCTASSTSLQFPPTVTPAPHFMISSI